MIALVQALRRILTKRTRPGLFFCNTYFTEDLQKWHIGCDFILSFSYAIIYLGNLLGKVVLLLKYKTESSPLVNPFKDVDARKRGRKKKVNTGKNILMTQDIAHYTHNIAISLDYRLEDVARFTESLFKDWYGDGDFLSIGKAAAKSLIGN